MSASTGHNLHLSPDQQQRGTEALIMALRSGRPEHSPESEPVVVMLNGPEMVFLLDDGERVAFDAAELLSSDPFRAALADLLRFEEAA